MKYLITTIAILMTVISYGQGHLNKADQAFKTLKYNEAIDHYVKYLESNKDEVAQTNLAESYFLTGQYPEAEAALKTLVDVYKKEGQNLLKYANLLIINNKKESAENVLDEYIKSNPSNEEYKRLYQSLQIKTEDPVHYQYLVENVPFTSNSSDFCPQYYGDQIIYASLSGGKTDPWTGSSYSNIYVANQGDNKGTLLKGNLNGKFHNGAVAFVDDDLMIFTRNNSKKGKNQDYNLILALAKKSGDKWKFEKEFTHNNKNYSNAYPAFIKEAGVLIFSSDRPGGFGGMDLYQSTWANGEWSDPVNLGLKVNTPRDEVFSSVDNGVLYFASNGHPGLGGLDIFASTFDGKVVEKPIHLNPPFNSNKDDFGLITNDDLETGYFSSNRSGNGQTDQIYSFKKESIELPPQEITISGKVIDEYTKMPLKETMVTLTNTTTGEQQTISTLENGRFSFSAISGDSYQIQGVKNEIKTTEEIVEEAKIQETYYFTLLHNDPRFSLEGYALNNKNQEGVEGVKVLCFNKSTLDENGEITNGEGFFKFQLDQNSDFEISGTKDGYFTSVSEASTKGLDRSATLYVKLYLTIEEVVIGETRILGKETFGGYKFDPVYYDLDKANIRTNAALALDKVVTFMQKNPTITIELGSHTDSRGSDQYNQNLSQRRAQSAVDYIVQRGIERSRISAKGYGESQLVNGCFNNIKCPESEHQLNRRTEIKVTGINN